MSQYFVGIELETDGFIAGEFDSFDEASNFFDKCTAVYFEISLDSARKYLKKCRKYKCNNEPFVIYFRMQQSDGYCSIFLIKIGDKWNSIDHFIADREYLPKFIKGAELPN